MEEGMVMVTVLMFLRWDTYLLVSLGEEVEPGLDLSEIGVLMGHFFVLAHLEGGRGWCV
jgi:hypothetical protein